MPTCRQRPDECLSFYSSILYVVHQVRGGLARLSLVVLEQRTQASRISNVSPDVSARPLDLHPEKIVELLAACAFLADKRDSGQQSIISSTVTWTKTPQWRRRRRFSLPLDAAEGRSHGTQSIWARLHPGIAGGIGGGDGRAWRRHLIRHCCRRHRCHTSTIRHPYSNTVGHPLTAPTTTDTPTTAATGPNYTAAATNAAATRYGAAGLSHLATLAHPQLVLPLLFLLQVNLRVERLTGFRLLQHTHKPTVSQLLLLLRAREGGWARGRGPRGTSTLRTLKEA